MDNHISRRRLLRTLGGVSMGVAGAQLVGGRYATPARAEELGAGTAPDAHPDARPPEFSNALTERFGMTYPIVQAGFSAFYVTPEMVAAVSNAGGLGCLGAVPEQPDGVRKLIKATKALTSRPFGIDYVYFPLYGATVYSPGYEKDAQHPTRALNWTCTDDHIDVVIEENLPFVVFFWEFPEQRWVQRLKKAGIEVWMQLATVDEARQAVDRGLDGIVAQGMQAGGHNRGYMVANPMPRSEVVPRIRAAVPKNIAVIGAGGVADGRTLATCLREGADAAWAGTVYASCAESYAHEEYKRRVIAVQDGWQETGPSRLFGPEWPQGFTRAIRNGVMREWAHKEDLYTTPPPPPAVIGTHKLMPWTVPGGVPYAMPKFSLCIPTRDTEGDFEEMCLLAGAESAPLVKEIRKAADITRDMGEGARKILLRERRKG
jgi:enoyl-[acyl-carrier protein] reductase II